MLTMRPPKRASLYFKAIDPDTAITESFIRRLIANGDIPSIKNGSRVLVAIEDIEAFIADSLGGSNTNV